ncbi:hypothetical protein BHM03_00027176 [Ensete ventricosum]|nr:hypothetical protein BHM03_00027176 [Ensete ventricosum]
MEVARDLGGVPSETMVVSVGCYTSKNLIPGDKDTGINCRSGEKARPSNLCLYNLLGDPLSFGLLRVWAAIWLSINWWFLRPVQCREVAQPDRR